MGGLPRPKSSSRWNEKPSNSWQPESIEPNILSSIGMPFSSEAKGFCGAAGFAKSMPAAAAACLMLFIMALLAAAFNALSMVACLAGDWTSSAGSIFPGSEVLMGELGVEDAFEVDTGSEEAFGLSGLDLSAYNSVEVSVGQQPSNAPRP